MRVLHVVQAYFPAIGGTERVIQSISENLVKRHGDQATVFTTTALNCELFWRRDQDQLQPGIESINGVTVRRFSVFNYFNRLRYLLAGGSYMLGLPLNDRFRALQNGPIVPGLTRAIADFGADVIAASSFPLLHMHDALRGGKKSRTPVVLFGGIHAADRYGFDRPMIYQAIRQADVYMAYTEFERAYLTGKGIDPAKIEVCGIGIELEKFAAASGQPLRNRLGWGASPVVGYFGQQVPHKGIDVLIDAMRHVWRSQPDACLLIAGARSTFSSVLESRIASLAGELRERVHIIHNFAEQDKAALFATADVVAYPSAHESFGIVFLEAWASRKPVIGVQTGAVGSVIADGRDGVLVRHRDADDLAAAILTLIRNPALAHAMGEAGYQKVVRQFTWDIVTDRYRAAYQRAVALRPRRQHMPSLPKPQD